MSENGEYCYSALHTLTLFASVDPANTKKDSIKKEGSVNIWTRLLVTVTVLSLACISYGSNISNTYQDQTNYYLVILSSLHGGTSSGISINNVGIVSGYSDLPDGVRHATFWQNQVLHDLGTFGGSGTNSSVAWPIKNNKGLIVGVSETDEIDPYLENWSCSGFFPTITNHQCLGFAWMNGVMNPLPTLGGNNGYAASANNKNQIVGWAENSTEDPTCDAPQRLQFRAALWGPNPDQVRELPPYADDPTSAATSINDYSQVVGISGLCNQAIGRLSAIHAILWEKGNIVLLPDLGVGAWNTPTSINQNGDIAGFVNQPGATVTGLRPQAVVWTRGSASSQYARHTLPIPSGDTRSFAWGLNNHGQIVGQSYGGPNGSRAILWNKESAIDLNSLTPPGSIPLVYANDINDKGEITGQAYDPDTGEFLAFVAIPPTGGLQAALRVSQDKAFPKGVAVEKILKRALQRFGMKDAELDNGIK
jgi:probable HAF family extracellular repeat protein